MTRRKKILISLIGTIVLGALLWLHYKERNNYECTACHSRKHLFQWRVGFWAGISFPLSSQWEQINESALCQDFFANRHVHDWVFAQGSPYYFFGTSWGGCAIGRGGDRNEFVQWYEIDSEFQQFIAVKVAQGKLPRDIVVQFASLPSWYDEVALNDAEKNKLRLLSETLVDEYLN